MGFPLGWTLPPDGGAASRAPNSQRETVYFSSPSRESQTPMRVFSSQIPLPAAIGTDDPHGTWATPLPPPTVPWVMPAARTPGHPLWEREQSPRRDWERLRSRHAPRLNFHAFGTQRDTGSAGTGARRVVALSQSTSRSPQPA